MRNHTPGRTICYRAVLTQALAHPGWSGGFPRARASPNGAEQQSCDSADTQQPVIMGPRPRSLNGSWAAALVSSLETASHPMAGVPAWPHPPCSASKHHSYPNSANSYFPPVSQPPSCTKRETHLHWAEGPGAFAGTHSLGAARTAEITPRAALAANTLALGTGMETHTPLPRRDNDKCGASAPAPQPLAEEGRPPSQAGGGPIRQGSELCSRFL